ncbi:hypothetical protein ACFOY4_34425 [Actinomadura syzygii]|uniref:Uncharacterized protein n=1 Tax=Actinomadura syzygii TaxID=1427538 RepID=A0A5D0UL68_9ACTN|nr:hypothetical protein [Actinomadura syzygii]TYC18844.1 hypothetical protein FXF65_03670 [Actinomadura syzygii]
MSSNDSVRRSAANDRSRGEPKTLVWAWVLVVIGNSIMRHFDGRGPGWAGLVLGAVGVVALPYSLVLGMRTTSGAVARIAVLAFHLAAFGSFFYFAATSNLWH